MTGGKKQAEHPKRQTKKRSRDKPKRPLSAYNFFFKDEREKIRRIIQRKKRKEDLGNNDPDSEDHIDDKIFERLRDEGGTVSFEEMGKVIGNRWKKIQPNHLDKYIKLAATDAERYKNELSVMNNRAKFALRSEVETNQRGAPRNWSGHSNAMNYGAPHQNAPYRYSNNAPPNSSPYYSTDYSTNSGIPSSSDYSSSYGYNNAGMMHQPPHAGQSHYYQAPAPHPSSTQHYYHNYQSGGNSSGASQTDGYHGYNTPPHVQGGNHNNSYY